MENKMRYVYQLSLADGRILINESEGLFSVHSPENPDDKVLINSAVLIKMYEKEETAVEVVDTSTTDEDHWCCDELKEEEAAE